MLPPATVFKLVSILGLDDNAFVVGGQAFNIWAERYAAGDAALSEFGPFTSKDLDYFGHLQAATKLATALQGKVNIPSLDDHTPHAAQVEAEVDGLWIEVDFITNVIGVRTGLETLAVELLIPYRTTEGEGVLEVPVMHPLHCFQSRVANVTRLGRTDDTALRQVNAAPIMLGHYIDEQLRVGDTREAQRVLRQLADFLMKDQDGRRAHEVCRVDPLGIIDRAEKDDRLDARFRSFNLAGLALRIRAGRELRRASGLIRRLKPKAVHPAASPERKPGG
ncbi:MAG: hypothetical protein K2X25_13540 [Caulobacteraceae bacterium]|nr:hypothetical protein [Caulobacteraceae bacterium]